MKLLLLSCGLAFALVAFSPPLWGYAKKYQVSGTIVDAQLQTPLEFATITVLDPDEQLVTGTVTDSVGRFALSLPSGSYRLRVEFLSFIAQQVEVDLQSDTDLGSIALQSDAQQMETVEVRAEKSQMEFKLDKKVFNVGKDLTNQGGSVNDVLENLPSVTVESTGTISLRGNSGVRILVNGKPSVIAANNGLSQIPAQSVERIEVITNPSARYQAAGSAGIINIVLKRNRLEGLSGSVEASVGYPADHSLTGNLAYKTQKYNLFGTLSGRYSNFRGAATNFQTSTVNGELQTLDQVNDQDRNDRAYNFYLGGDYYFNAHNTLTTAFYHYALDNTDETRLNYDFLNSSGVADSTIRRVENYFEPQRYNQLEVSYVRTFAEKEGKKWTGDFQYDFWNDDEQENILTRQLRPLPLGRSEIRTRTLESSKDFLLQSDLVLPLGKQSRLELGLRGERRIITSDFVVEEKENEDWQPYRSIDNELDYTERIGGAYVQYGRDWERWNLLLGLRTEYTDVEIRDVQERFGNRKDYWQLFPTFHLTRTLSENSRLQLSYSRRIRRPSFWQLNPFGGLTDNNVIFIGNPDLDPAYVSSLELTWLQNFERWTFNPALYVQRVTDYFQFYIEPADNSDNAFVTIPINLDREDRYGLELSTSYNPAKWLQLSADFNYYGFRQNGFFEERDFSFADASWFTRLSARLRLPADFTFQARFNYQGENPDAQALTLPIYFADFALSKNLLGKKAALTLNVRNAFDTRRERRIIDTDGYRLEQMEQWVGRRIRLAFQYRFNRQPNQRDRQPGRRNR